MKRQKAIAFVLACVMILPIMTACGPQKSNDPSESSATESASTANALTPGTYTASAKGYGGDLELSVSVDETKITNIEVLKSSETEGIGGEALKTLPGDVIESQSLGIEAVSGATMTSTAFLTALTDCLTQAGADVDEWKARPVEKEVSSDPVEKETDVVVVGGGGAGLSAAISAAQNGAKVILIEKTAALGGNTVRAGGPYNAVDPARQKNVPAADQASMDKIAALLEKETKSPEHQALKDQLQKDLDEYNAGTKDYLFDSIALHKLQTYDGGDYVGNLTLIEKLVDESLPTSEWMAENGVVWKDAITTVPGGLWPRAHLPQNAAGADYIAAGKATAEKLGVEILYNAPAKELILENGAVCGVKGTLDGAPLTIKAKSVVLATGGFAGNKEMRQQYVPALNDKLPTTNAPSIQGDGIVLGLSAGANLVGMEYIQSLPLGNAKTGALNGWMGGAGVEYYYQINQEGKRFMAEDGRRDVMTAALIAQTDSMSYVITSADNTLDYKEDGINIWGDNVEELVKNGEIFKADTIEDLAAQIGVDPAVLKETHDNFNSYVEAGNDPEFGRTLFGKPLTTPPFFASKRVPTVHHTMGGLEINKSCEVLNLEGAVIPGLFAAGEVTGGIHGANRLGGNALVDIHVFGRTAGQTASNFALGK
ncbi:MAG: flavocytochrome c [Ndongobacter sp.]|nr:flavocytochrome c [Ndongobacter sp.]